ncbi:MAG: hypothetical protein OXH31_09115 [Gammaproteobacteria bacterium]|nr:hypothetical protein [Gammaproteobacteria bacterium]
MKLSFFANVLLTGSAFAPAVFIYAIVWFNQGSYFGGWICLSIGVVLLFVCWGVVRYAVNTLQSHKYYAVQVEAADSEIISFLLIYLLPLLTDDFSTQSWWAWILVAFVFCLLVARSYGYQFHPVMAILGWHFFKVTDNQGRTSVLITKNKLYNPKEEIRVGKIGEYVLIDQQLTTNGHRKPTRAVWRKKEVQPEAGSNDEPTST